MFPFKTADLHVFFQRGATGTEMILPVTPGQGTGGALSSRAALQKAPEAPERFSYENHGKPYENHGKPYKNHGKPYEHG